MRHCIQVSALMRHMCLHRKIGLNPSQIFPLEWRATSVILLSSALFGLLYCSNFVPVSALTPCLSCKWQFWLKDEVEFL